MKITKNGFYKLSEINSEKITIEKNLVVSFFDDSPSPQPSPLKERGLEVYIGENSKVEIFGVLKNIDDFKLEVIQKQENSDLKLNYLILSKDGDNIKSKIESKLNANHVKSDVVILSIVGNGGNIDLDGIIEIEEGVEKVDGNLIEENIFLGDTGRVQGIPTLLVRSDDVKASHSCKMERVSDEKLFYLRSRGIGRDNALNMIIEAKIESLFSCLRMYDKDFYEKVIEDILETI